MENNDILLVKNYQPDSVVRKMYQKAFGSISNDIKISPLTGGLKNAVYLIEDNEKKIVLKIGAKDESKSVTLDRNTMWWEAKMLKLMESIDIPTPKLLYFDNSGEICSSPYIFMTYISGRNFLDCKSELSQEEISNIEYELGKISYQICSIKNDEFFLPSQPTKKFSNNYEFVRNLFVSLLHDASTKNLLIGTNSMISILKVLDEHRESLNNMNGICLNHVDLWDGNVLVENGKITGVLDFSDLYFCDELMTFYFHTASDRISDDYLRGFNHKVLTRDELIRIQIYRLYTLLKMMVDVEFKGYGKYDWMYQKFDEGLKKVKNIHKL